MYYLRCLVKPPCSPLSTHTKNYSPGITNPLFVTWPGGICTAVARPIILKRSMDCMNRNCCTHTGHRPSYFPPYHPHAILPWGLWWWEQSRRGLEREVERLGTGTTIIKYGHPFKDAGRMLLRNITQGKDLESWKTDQPQIEGHLRSVKIAESSITKRSHRSLTMISGRHMYVACTRRNF